MYARAVNVQFQSGKVDEANHIVKDAIIPVLKEQRGFKGQFVFTQRDTGKAISINLWESEADLIAFESSSLYRELTGKHAGVLAGAPAEERYEVSIRT
jgi:heme-degrading monooxygenase HmoA